MARRRKEYDDDDGRTIVDMSGVERTPLFIPRPPKAAGAGSAEEPEDGKKDRPWEKGQSSLSREERRWYILGALKAALLIALVFIVGLGLAVLLMLLAWT